MNNIDNVNSPKHYQIEGLNIESIDIIKSLLGDKFIAFCVGNTVKYLIRAEKKNGREDYEKAKVYLKWASEEQYKYRLDFNFESTHRIANDLNIEWLDVVSAITATMPFKKALRIHNAFHYIFNGYYKIAIDEIDLILKV